MDVAESWFSNCYLKPQQFKISSIRSRDFEGILKDAIDQSVCLFELKYLENPNITAVIDKTFEEAGTKSDDGLIPFPKWKEIKSILRDKIGEAVSQLKNNAIKLSEVEQQSLPRIIFILTTQVGNIGESEIVDAIKGGRRFEFPHKESKVICPARYGYNSELNGNTAIDVFSDQFISGVIVIYPITLKFEEGCGIQKVLVINNKMAKNEIPKLLFEGLKSVNIISV